MEGLTSERRKRADVLLRDAQMPALSDRTRIECAFDAGYLYLLDVAARRGRAATVDHPSARTLAAGFEGLELERADRRLATRLLRWVRRRGECPAMPCSVDDAIRWGMSIARSTAPRSLLGLS
ncbi:hypothetical protein PTE30175_03585 [Pandoraea terrae]|uniref:Uncharacterized protein n=1 Tax=Pandoraea terrae TaxID=1537710 RepID=A0A5E4X5L1_9BURK|nr:hypothetical protein [Pandoraea terrae]VVE31627.1 hypothetical protein PTE30175_03585 [Pandoraea terrae]